jgi:hypothetical protein
MLPITAAALRAEAARLRARQRNKLPDSFVGRRFNPTSLYATEVLLGRPTKPALRLCQVYESLRKFISLEHAFLIVKVKSSSGLFLVLMKY